MHTLSEESRKTINNIDSMLDMCRKNGTYTCELGNDAEERKREIRESETPVPYADWLKHASMRYQILDAMLFPDLSQKEIDDLINSLLGNNV